MRYMTASIGMPPTPRSSVAASRPANETSGRQFDMPIEFPANMRELARDALAQTRENYEQVEIAANELVSTLVSTQSTAARSIANYRAWLMKVAHLNVISAFDFAQNLATAKSVPDVIECTRTHARVQLDALALQTNELTELACSVATKMAETIKTSIATAGEA
jgi:hypothetical protein